MRYAHHLHACNAWDPSRFLPFRAAGQRLGWVRRDHARDLEAFPDIVTVRDGEVRLSNAFDDLDARSEAIDRLGRALVKQGRVAPYRGELFAAVPDWGAACCFELDRGLLPYFGLKGFGVHLNGYVSGATGPDLWIGHRSATKKVDPLKLDNVVAGGIAAGYGVWETLLKEGAEEADMTPEVLARAQPAGQIRYRLEIPEGMRDDVLFVYDLELPEEFTPRNTDGEFDSFQRMPLQRCLDLVARTDLFKFNVNLTVIDFALRHGAIPAADPEHAFLASALQGGLIPEA